MAVLPVRQLQQIDGSTTLPDQAALLGFRRRSVQNERSRTLCPAVVTTEGSGTVEPMKTYRKGDQVVGLGRGRRSWPSRPVGTVTAVRGGSVFVKWHNTCVEDEMAPEELESAEEQRR